MSAADLSEDGRFQVVLSSFLAQVYQPIKAQHVFCIESNHEENDSVGAGLFFILKRHIFASYLMPFFTVLIELECYSFAKCKSMRHNV